jgi:hypothetical protein
VRLAAVLGGLGFLCLLMALVQRGREATLNETLILVYTACAVLGGTVLVCQFLMTLLGLGHHHEFGGADGHDVGGHDVGGHDVGGHDAHAEGEHHEVGHDQETTGNINLLTFRTVVAALTFFGLGGRAAEASGADPAASLTLALAAGAGALFLVAWLMRTLYGLRSDGTVRIQRAVGLVGTVYLPIPGHRAGPGKVHLNLQNRTVEYQAVTAQGPLPVGAKVTVVAVIGSDTVEVIPAPSLESVTHG